MVRAAIVGLGVIAASHMRIQDALERGERPPVSTDDVWTVTEFISSLYKSAVTRQVVERGSILPGDPFYEHLAGTLAQAHLAV
jgi:hypothetical protein